MAPTLAPDPNMQRRHRRVALVVAFAAMGMVGMSYAAVPLYQMFCRVTGYGGVPQIGSSESSERGDKVMTIRFDANVASDLPWTFEPEQSSIKLRNGETATVFYKVRNRSDKTTHGLASYNVTPERSGIFFTKLSCFCFSEQTLAPGETMDMPVVFYVDPSVERDEIMKSQDTITLSYTFYASKTPVASNKGKPAL
jgi:cytochrome c oxidase assembly protein subunit 11